MKLRAALALFLFLLPACALAAKSPACEMLGSLNAACHLASHLQAYTHGWDGASVSFAMQDGCEDYGHVHCYGRKVSVWDTPRKGPNRVPYYAGTNDGYIFPEDEFQLADVVAYQGKYYAQIRTYVNGYARLSGFVNADYIGCDCADYQALVPVPVYDSIETIQPE